MDLIELLRYIDTVRILIVVYFRDISSCLNFCFPIGSKLGMIDSSATASMTGGLVAQQEHIVLPSISALTTAIITVFTMMVFITYFIHYIQTKIVFNHQLHLPLAITLIDLLAILRKNLNRTIFHDIL